MLLLFLLGCLSGMNLFPVFLVKIIPHLQEGKCLSLRLRYSLDTRRKIPVFLVKIIPCLQEGKSLSFWLRYSLPTRRKIPVFLVKIIPCLQEGKSLSFSSQPNCKTDYKENIKKKVATFNCFYDVNIRLQGYIIEGCYFLVC